MDFKNLTVNDTKFSIFAVVCTGVLLGVFALSANANADEKMFDQTAKVVRAVTSDNVNLQEVYEISMCYNGAYETLTRFNKEKPFLAEIYSDLSKEVDFDKVQREIFLVANSKCGTGLTPKKFYRRTSKSDFECLKANNLAILPWIKGAGSVKKLAEDDVDNLIKIEVNYCRKYFSY